MNFEMNMRNANFILDFLFLFRLNYAECNFFHVAFCSTSTFAMAQILSLSLSFVRSRKEFSVKKFPVDTKGFPRFPIKNIIKSAQMLQLLKVLFLSRLRKCFAFSCVVDNTQHTNWREWKNYFFLAFIKKYADNMNGYVSPSYTQFGVLSVQFKLYFYSSYIMCVASMEWLQFPFVPKKRKKETLSKILLVFLTWAPLFGIVIDSTCESFLCFLFAEVEMKRRKQSWNFPVLAKT